MAECNNNVPDYVVLPSEGTGTTGPVGPAGPQGPPGIGSLPVPAADVSVTNDGYNTAQEIFDALLYVLISISSFTANKTVYEIGESIVALGFTWGLNKVGITSQVITGAHVETGTELGIVVRNSTLTFSPALAASSTFTLNVNDGTNVATSNRTISFYSGVYFGDAAAPASIDSNFLLSLGKTLQSGRGKSFVSNAGVDVYAWYANKTALGVANFNVGGFDGGFNSPVTISFTNSVGHTENYYVYRSTNPQIGPANILVT